MNGLSGGKRDGEDLPLYKRLKVGDLVVARYSEDRLHYEAEIQQVQGWGGGVRVLVV